jgi:hypothetical protein
MAINQNEILNKHKKSKIYFENLNTYQYLILINHINFQSLIGAFLGYELRDLNGSSLNDKKGANSSLVNALTLVVKAS